MASLNKSLGQLVCLLLASITVAHGQFTNNFQVLNINFDHEPYGAAPQVQFIPSGPFPQTNLALTVESDGFGSTDFANSNGVKTTVGDIGNLTKALIFSNNFDFIASTYVDTQFGGAPKAALGVMDFDFVIGNTPGIANHMLGPNTPDGQDFVINAFHNAGVAFRFVLSHTSETGGNIQLRIPGQPSTNLVTVATYSTGVTYHARFEINYVLGTLDFALDGNTLTSSYQFALPQSTVNDQITEFFIFQNGRAGEMSVHGLDNLTYILLPEPSSLAMAGVAIAGFFIVLRRKRS